MVPPRKSLRTFSKRPDSIEASQASQEPGSCIGDPSQPNRAVHAAMSRLTRSGARGRNEPSIRRRTSMNKLCAGDRRSGRHWARGGGSLARESQTVVIFDVNREAGTQVAAELHERGLAVDFQGADVSEGGRRPGGIRRTCCAYRQLDVLVNVAGAAFIDIRSMNLPGALADGHRRQPCIDLPLLPRSGALMTRQGSGTIINISSDIAFSGDAGLSAYAGQRRASSDSRVPWRSSWRPAVCG